VTEHVYGARIDPDSRDIAIGYHVNAAITSRLTMLPNAVPQMREQSEVS